MLKRSQRIDPTRLTGRKIARSDPNQDDAQHCPNQCERAVGLDAKEICLGQIAGSETDCQPSKGADGDGNGGLRDDVSLDRCR